MNSSQRLNVNGVRPWGLTPLGQKGSEQTSQRGFTLMETLLAITLFVIVSVASTSIFSLGLQIWKRTRTDSKTEQRVLLAFEKMGQDLRSMVRLAPKPEQFSIQKNHFFEYAGSSTEVQIPAAYGPGENPVLSGYGRTIYRWDSGSGELCRSVENAADLMADKKPDCRVLATGVVKFKIRYWLPSGLEDSYSWYDHWDPEDGIPLAVEINLEVKDENTSSRPEVFRKTIVIPVGGKYE